MQKRSKFQYGLVVIIRSKNSEIPNLSEKLFFEKTLGHEQTETEGLTQDRRVRHDETTSTHNSVVFHKLYF